MSKKPELKDLPGLGPKLEEKLVEAGIKTVLNLSRAKADKLAEKVDGLSVSRAEALIAAAQETLQSVPTPVKEAKPKKAVSKEAAPAKKPATKTAPKKKVEAEVEAPKKKVSAKEAPKKKAEEKPKPSKKAAKITEVKPKKKAVKKEKPEVPVRFKNLDQRLVRIKHDRKIRMPKFHAENAHRWTRISRRWRKIRGIDSYTRQKKKGRIAMVSPGYRTPKAIRYLHPSMYKEVPVYRPSDLESLDPDIHAVRIAATVGGRKRQDILERADARLIRVLNPGTKEEIGEEDLFTDLDLEED
ncbi:MAG: 50S ribosomal protein L32e [Candidatus Thorarchaeota archaeon]|nr:50S ribosomal protein L32e [Candidatus Thorarchaeota archaeon]